MGAFKRLRAILAQRTVEQTILAVAGIVVALVLATGVLADMNGATSSTSSTASVSSTPTKTPLGCAVGDEVCAAQTVAGLACHMNITPTWTLERFPDPELSYPPARPDHVQYFTPSGTPAVVVNYYYGYNHVLTEADVICEASYATGISGTSIYGDEYERLLRPGTLGDLPTQLRY